MKWKEYPLGKFCKVLSGYAFKSKDFRDNGVPVLKIKNIRIGHTDLNDCQYVSSDYLMIKTEYHLKRDDVLIALTGSHMDKVNSAAGRIAKYSSEPNPCLLNQRAGKFIITNPDLLNQKYLYYYLFTDTVSTQLGNFSHGSANQANISPRDVEKVNIPIAPLSIQEKIASILSAYDNLIENNLRRIELLEKAARELYKEWFIRFKFPGYEEVKFKDGLPEGWEKKPSFEIMDILSGGTPSTTVEKYWDGKIPFFTPKDATSTFFVPETQKYLSEIGLQNCNSRLFEKYTLFITARGTVGNLNLNTTPMAMNQSCYALVSRKPMDQFYLYLMIQANIEHLKQKSGGAVFDAIIIDTFKFIYVTIPSTQILKRFCSLIDPLFLNIEKLVLQNNLLKQARDLLLPRLMKGEIEVEEEVCV